MITEEVWWGNLRAVAEPFSDGHQFRSIRLECLRKLLQRLTLLLQMQRIRNDKLTEPNDMLFEDSLFEFCKD